MAEQDRFSLEEWRTLQFAPLWMFSAVVGGYRKFHPLEFEAFSRSLDTAAFAPGRLSREVMTSVSVNVGRVMEEYRRDGRTIGTGLCQVAAILTKVPPEEAELFKGTLLTEIGEGVAKARGRFGREMSEEDAKNLDLVAQFLG